MCSVSSAQGTSTCDARDLGKSAKSARSGYEEYVRFAAKDSDSDSDIEGDVGCTVYTGESIEDAQDAKKDASPACASTVQRAGLTAVPDHNGVRFCRVCNAFLPLSMFPKGHRRYTCRPHLWQRIGKKARKAAYKAAPRRRLLASIWTRCWKDVNSSCLGMCSMAHGKALALKQADIGGMLDALEASQSRKFSLASLPASCTSADRVCKAEGLLTALDAQRWTMNTVAVLPADLSKPVSKENAVLVTKPTRVVLLDKLRRARKALGGLKAPNTPNDAALCTLNQAHAKSAADSCCDSCACSAEKQKHLAALWRKSIQAAALFPVAPVDSGVSLE